MGDIGKANGAAAMADPAIDRFTALRRTYAAQLGPTMAAIRQDWARFRSGADDDAAERVRASVHRLTGSGATFGYSDLSDAAREASDVLERIVAAEAPFEVGVDQIEGLLAKLMQVANDIEGDPDATADRD
jgi:chemotaxis protein histidine kinase CheA